MSLSTKTIEIREVQPTVGWAPENVTVGPFRLEADIFLVIVTVGSVKASE